jgi:hypothetical protein
MQDLCTIPLYTASGNFYYFTACAIKANHLHRSHKQRNLKDYTMTDNITYNNIKTRAETTARELLPPLPTNNTLDNWQSFQDELESFDIYDAAHTEADSWDVTIYHYKAMALCTDAPIGVLHAAESQRDETDDEKPSGLYELASTLAYWIIQAELVKAMKPLQSELIDLADDQIGQF